jgi:hypothetical protein
MDFNVIDKLHLSDTGEEYRTANSKSAILRKLRTQYGEQYSMYNIPTETGTAMKLTVMSI